VPTGYAALAASDPLAAYGPTPTSGADHVRVAISHSGLCAFLAHDPFVGWIFDSLDEGVKVGIAGRRL
jgi:hypothetical protein